MGPIRPSKALKLLLSNGKAFGRPDTDELHSDTVFNSFPGNLIRLPGCLAQVVKN